MTTHEFGKENEQVVVLIHPSIVMWDYFEYVYPLIEKKYHLIIPAIPGYDPDGKSDFTSVEEISAELEDWLIKNNLNNVACLYGCSMGGSIVVRMLADNNVNIKSAVIDGGITPYQLSFFCQFIAYGYEEFFQTQINRLKTTLAVPTGDPAHDNTDTSLKE